MIAERIRPKHWSLLDGVCMSSVPSWRLSHAQCVLDTRLMFFCTELSSQGPSGSSVFRSQGERYSPGPQEGSSLMLPGQEEGDRVSSEKRLKFTPKSSQKDMGWGAGEKGTGEWRIVIVPVSCEEPTRG